MLKVTESDSEKLKFCEFSGAKRDSTTGMIVSHVKYLFFIWKIVLAVILDWKVYRCYWWC